MPWLAETALFLILGSSLMVAWYSGPARAGVPARIRTGFAAGRASRNNMIRQSGS